MPALNFYPRFADQVASGQKRQSIRQRQFHRGAPLYLYIGMRTKNAKRIAVATVTTSRAIVIDYVRYEPSISINGIDLSAKEMEHFARADGFNGLDDFMDFFSENYEMPFEGFVVEWDLAEQAEGVAA
jgi:hypothetical protein